MGREDCPDVPAPPCPIAPPHAGHRAWQAVDWDVHRRWVRIEGRRASVLDVGEGPPLLLVHGLGGSWRNWLETVPGLMADHRVIAPDLPGFGGSEVPRADVSVPAYAGWLDALCDDLGLGPVAAVGSSMGGLICAELAVAFPARVERLGLVSAAGFTVERPGNDQKLALLRRLRPVVRLYMRAAALVAGHPEPFARRATLRRLLLGQTFAHPERLPPALAAEQLRGAGKPGFLAALEAVMSYPIRERLPQIACPVLVVWGDRDRLISVRDADLFEQLIPDVGKVVYPETGHAPMLEQPDRFTADLRAFLYAARGASAAAAHSARTASANASTSSGRVSHEHIQRTSPVRSSHL